MNHDSSICAFLLTSLYLIFLVITLCISYYSCTCWVPTISVLNLSIFPLLLKLVAPKEKMDWNSSTTSSRLALSWLLVLWCYEVFHCSISCESRFSLRDIIYVINILYSWHLVICEYFWSVFVEQLILGIHTMSTWFWHKNRPWHQLV
jgi:hypothetical protein